MFTTPKVAAPEFVMVTAPRLFAVPVPSAPVKVTLPVPACSVSDSSPVPAVPSVLPVTRMLPAVPAPVDSVGDAPSATTRFPPMLRSVLAVVMFAARFTLPLVLNAPVLVMAPVIFLVSIPVLAIVVVPMDAKLLFTAYAVPRRSAEPTATVFPKVVVPVAAFVCTRAPVMFTTPKVAAPEFVMVTAPRLFAVPVPSAPVKVTLPVPACSVSDSSPVPAVPSVLPVTRMLPAVPAPVDSVGDAPSATTRFPPMLRSVLAVVMFAARFTLPLVLNAPVLIMAPVLFFMNSPEFNNVVVPPTLMPALTVIAAPVNAKLPV